MNYSIAAMVVAKNEHKDGVMLKKLSFMAFLFVGAAGVQATNVQEWSNTKIISNGSVESVAPLAVEAPLGFVAGDFRGYVSRMGWMRRDVDFSGPFNATMTEIASPDASLRRIKGLAVLANDGLYNRRISITADVANADGENPTIESLSVSLLVIGNSVASNVVKMQEIVSDLAYDASTGTLSGVFSGKSSNKSIENVAFSVVLNR